METGILGAIHKLTDLCIEKSLEGNICFKVEVTRIADGMHVMVIRNDKVVSWVNGSTGFRFYDFERKEWNINAENHIYWCMSEVRRISNER